MRYARFLVGAVLLCSTCTWAQTIQPAARPAAQADDDSPADRLGDRFNSLAAGISFQPPAGGVQTKHIGMGTDIVQYTNAEEKWAMKVSHLILDQPSRLLAEDPKALGEDQTTPRRGVLDEAARQLRLQNASIQVLRKDVINVGRNDVGLLICRYTQGAQVWLRQQAFVQANLRNYYVFDFTTPSGRPLSGADDEEDSMEAMAVSIFNAVLDSVQLLDQRAVAQDYEQRLYRTRTLELTLTKRLENAILPQQYFRFIRRGKDVGWSYITEELTTRQGAKGILLAAVLHNFLQGPDKSQTVGTVDSACEMFYTLDHSANEIWITVNNVEKDGKREETSEVGQSIRQVKRVFEGKPGEQGSLEADPRDPGNPKVRVTELYKLEVTQGNKAASKQITRLLPPFYLPQVVGSMLPRVLPLNEPKGYLFATWVGSEQEVIHRYIDVEPERDVTFNGQQLRAVVVKDRIGLEGDPTFHYLTPEGRYLGSSTPSTGLAILAVDQAALTRLYPKAVFRHPQLLDAPSMKKQ